VLQREADEVGGEGDVPEGVVCRKPMSSSSPTIARSPDEPRHGADASLAHRAGSPLCASARRNSPDEVPQHSTRWLTAAERKRFCEILLEGLASDGGLYLPEHYPADQTMRR
jgi:hypothetical protein